MAELPIGCDVLCCSYGGGHVAALEPVARRLSAEGLKVGYLALTTAQSFLAERGIPHFGFADFHESIVSTEIDHADLMLADNNSALVSQEETLAYLKTNYSELVATHGATEAKAIYQRHGRQAFFPVQAMRQLLEIIKPKLVISTNSPRSERAMLTAAAALSIPRICLVDLFGLHEVKWIREKNYADYICVLNESVREFFLSEGCDSDKVKVTGNPAFDLINTDEVMEAGKNWRRSRNIPESAKLILWASQVEPEIHPFTGQAGNVDLPQRIESTLLEAISQHPEWHLIIRPHPSERRTVTMDDRVVFSPPTEPLHPLLHAADLVVVMSSTVGLEAWMAGIKVVSVEASVFSPDAPYAEFGIATGISDAGELVPILEEKLQSKTKSPHYPQTDATEEVSKLARSLLE